MHLLSVLEANDSANLDLWLQNPCCWSWISWNHILCSRLQMIHRSSPSYFCVAILTSSRSEETEKIKDQHLSNKRHTVFLMAISLLFSQFLLPTSFSCAQPLQMYHTTHTVSIHTDATRSPSSLWQQQLRAACASLHWLSSSTALFILALKQRIPVYQKVCTLSTQSTHLLDGKGRDFLVIS